LAIPDRDISMAPQSAAKKRWLLYVLLALGFAGLIGAHEWAVMLPPPSGGTSTVPFILATLGTLCFVAAGFMARKLMKDGALM
jgi:hypothetical protein